MLEEKAMQPVLVTMMKLGNVPWRLKYDLEGKSIERILQLMEG